MKRWIVFAIAVVCALVLAPYSALAASKADKNFLKNIKVTGSFKDGTPFNGKLTITEFGYDEKLGLTVSGVVQGHSNDAKGKKVNIKESFTDVPATLNEKSATKTNRALNTRTAFQQSCQILFLDIGPIFLDLLGLQLDLSEIVLDLTAVQGPGNLLGNLLCAVAGLLDPNGLLSDLANTLDDLIALLEQINSIIG